MMKTFECSARSIRIAEQEQRCAGDNGVFRYYRMSQELQKLYDNSFGKLTAPKDENFM